MGYPDVLAQSLVLVERFRGHRELGRRTGSRRYRGTLNSFLSCCTDITPAR